MVLTIYCITKKNQMLYHIFDLFIQRNCMAALGISENRNVLSFVIIARRNRHNNDAALLRNNKVGDPCVRYNHNTAAVVTTDICPLWL